LMKKKTKKISGISFILTIGTTPLVLRAG